MPLRAGRVSGRGPLHAGPQEQQARRRSKGAEMKKRWSSCAASTLNKSSPSTSGTITSTALAVPSASARLSRRQNRHQSPSLTPVAFDDATGSEASCMSTNWQLEPVDRVFGTHTCHFLSEHSLGLPFLPCPRARLHLAWRVGRAQSGLRWGGRRPGLLHLRQPRQLGGLRRRPDRPDQLQPGHLATAAGTVQQW